MNKWKTDEIVRIVLMIAEKMKHKGPMLNERYLHHYFSHLVQNEWNILDLIGKQNQEMTLHPEWPTFKKQTDISYGRYKKENGQYLPNSDGTAGFIDFAVGDYEKPEIGIEFSLKYGWSHEEVVYDFLKLLDRRNPFKTSISLNIIFRKEKLVRGGYLKDLQNHMDEAYEEAVRRLGKDVVTPEERELYLIITEIAQDNKRKYWHFDNTSRKFELGLS